jgi:hypothetical protein
MPGEQAITRAAVGVLSDPTGTEDVAGADLQQASFQLIGHVGHLLDG